MKSTQITLIIFLYIGFFTIGYYIIEYANINNIRMQKENQYLSERVEQLISENFSLKEEIENIRQKSDVKYFYFFISLCIITIILVAFLIFYYKTFNNLK